MPADAVSHTERTIHVGPYPKDAAVSPDGTKAYVAVTGGDSGKGGAGTKPLDAAPLGIAFAKVP